MVAIRNVSYYVVACQIAIFVNSATVIKVWNAKIEEKKKMKEKIKLLYWKEL